MSALTDLWAFRMFLNALETIWEVSSTVSEMRAAWPRNSSLTTGSSLLPWHTPESRPVCRR